MNRKATHRARLGPRGYRAIIAATLPVLAAVAVAQPRDARAAQRWWDANGATAGAGGLTPTGTWGVNDFWSTNADGTVATGAWTSGDTAIFSAGADATGTYAVTVSGTQTVGGLAFEEGNVTLSGGTLSLTGATNVSVSGGDTSEINSTLAGAGPLNKAGTATLQLSGANTYTGGTTINAGMLTATGGNALPNTGTVTLANVAGAALRIPGGTELIGGLVGGGATGGNVEILGTANLAVNQGFSNTFAGAISGTGSLEKRGVGMLTLTGANTYSGGTTLFFAGTLQVGANNAAGTGSVTIRGGNFDLAADQTVTNLTFGPGNSGTVTGSGTLTLTGNLIFNPDHLFTPPGSIFAHVALPAGDHIIENNGSKSSMIYDLILGGSMSGAGGLTKAGFGLFPCFVAITSAGNTYTGGTTVISGRLFLAATNALPTNGAVTVNNGTLTLNPIFTESGVVAGNYSQSIGSLAGASAGFVDLGSATLTIGNDHTSTTYLGAISGTNGSLTKVGTGTLTLGGSNTYTGTTTVSAGTIVLESNLPTSSSVSVANGAVLRLAAGGTRVVRTPSLSVAGSGKLDLKDNKLIVTGAGAIGTWNGSSYTGVAGLIDAGRGNASNAQWDGSGIVTSDTRAVNNNDLCSIGVALASQVKGVASTATTTFAGQTVLGSAVLAMFTWGGDANLDGKINIDDYGQIDFNVGSSGSVFGWFNGDFNFDGKINIDDYGIIDFNVTAQTGTFPTVDRIEGVAAVPEPAGGLILLGLAAAVPGRRCRSSRLVRR